MSFADLPRSVLGKEYEVLEYPAVTAEELIAYARSLGVSEPIYLDEAAAGSGPHGGLVAFPTFVVKLGGIQQVPEEVAREMIAAGGFDAGKDIELGVPIRPGDRLTSRSRLLDIYEKTGRSGSMWFVVCRQELHNQRGELVATVDTRLMQRGRSGQEEQR